MPGRLLLALLVALAVSISVGPAEAQTWDDPVADVDVAALPEVETTAPPTSAAPIHDDVPALRPRDVSPPPVPPPER